MGGMLTIKVKPLQQLFVSFSAKKQKQLDKDRLDLVLLLLLLFLLVGDDDLGSDLIDRARNVVIACVFRA